MTDAVFAFWPSVRDRWDALEGAIGPELAATGATDIHLARPADLHALLLDIYMRKDAALAPETRGMFLAVIAEKARVMAEAGLAFRVVTARLAAGGPADPGPATERVKARLRALAPCAVRRPYRLNLNVHASDGRREAGLLADVLLNPVGLAHLACRPAPAPRAEVLDRLHALRTWCREAGVDTREVCIVGGAVLEACGLRAGCDLDFVARPRLRPAGAADGIKDVAPGCDLAGEGYHRTAAGPGAADDALIDDPALHFTVIGFKHAALPLVLESKRATGRVKDARDAGLLASPETARISGAILAAMRAAGAALPAAAGA